jgi:hypothetical protein
MRSLKTAIYTTLGLLVVFALQFALAYRIPYWGLRSPFPFTILRSVAMPILFGLCGAVSAFSAKSAAERRLFYSVIAASLAEIVAIKAMLWLSQPLLMLLVFFLNAFITVQFLRYGQLMFALKQLEMD